MYYEDKYDHYDDRRDWIHVSETPDTEKMAEVLESIVKQLYTSFDETSFEDTVEELCDLLKVKMPVAELTIERRQKWAKTA